MFYIMVKKFFVCFGYMSAAAIDLECLFYSEYMICFTLLLIHKYAGRIIQLLDFITIRVGSRHSLTFVHARGHACQSGSPVCSGSSRPASINVSKA